MADKQTVKTNGGVGGAIDAAPDAKSKKIGTKAKNVVRTSMVDAAKSELVVDAAVKLGEFTVRVTHRPKKGEKLVGMHATFANEADARKRHDELVAQCVKAGWKIVASATPVAKSQFSVIPAAAK